MNDTFVWLDSTHIVDHVSNILTSDEEITLGECTFYVTFRAMPQGQGKSKKNY
jgi:hypothetical protein